MSDDKPFDPIAELQRQHLAKTGEPTAAQRRETLRFELQRKVTGDESTVVAVGVQFSDGTVVLRWLGEHPSTAVYADWADVMRVHHVGEPGHTPWTTAVWFDGVCFACGHTITKVGVHSGGNGSQCCACSSCWQGPPNRYLGEHPTNWKRSIELPARKEPTP